MFNNQNFFNFDFVIVNQMRFKMTYNEFNHDQKFIILKRKFNQLKKIRHVISIDTKKTKKFLIYVRNDRNVNLRYFFNDYEFILFQIKNIFRSIVIMISKFSNAINYQIFY